MTGRPPTLVVPGQRYSLGLKVTAEVKATIDGLARATGRTQSQVCEQLVTQALRDRWLLDEIKQMLAPT